MVSRGDSAEGATELLLRPEALGGVGAIVVLVIAAAAYVVRRQARSSTRPDRAALKNDPPSLGIEMNPLHAARK